MGETSTSSGVRPQPKGSIDTLPSGSLRVRVYAGVDVFTKNELYLTEVIKAGDNAQRMAEEVRDKFVRQVIDNRQPKTNIELAHLVEIHLDAVKLDPKTKSSYRGYARKHIKALDLGRLPISKPRAMDFDRFDAELRRCRDHCDDGQPIVKHYTPVPHRCNSRCKKHVCRPLADATIRKIHFIISGAYQRAIRYEWVGFNPVLTAETPAAPPPDPRPPTTEEAVALINEAWRWGFGPFIWLAMVTGARRGELCALRWSNLHIRHAQYGAHNCVDAGCQWSLHIRRAMGQDGKSHWEKDTKTHQIRMVALDVQTVAILTELRDRAERIARLLGIQLPRDAYMFARSDDGLVACLPEYMSKRFGRIATRLKIDTTLKAFRHYSATELIGAGVDIRTVAGRLGHSGGGTTTLKFYTAFLSARDQHASTVLMNRMPIDPPASLDGADRALVDPQSPYETVAAELLCALLDGTYPAGTSLPSVKELALAHGVSVSTAHRAMSVLKEKGVVAGTSGTRAVVLPIDEANPAIVALRMHRGGSLAAFGTDIEDDQLQHATAVDKAPQANEPTALDLELLRMDVPVRTLWTEADPGNFVQLRKLMESAVKRLDGDLSKIDEYELAIRRAGEPQVIRTLVVAA